MIEKERRLRSNVQAVPYRIFQSPILPIQIFSIFSNIFVVERRERGYILREDPSHACVLQNIQNRFRFSVFTSPDCID